MVRAVEIFAAINLIVMGVSHILQPQAWNRFFTVLHAKGVAGSFMNAMLSLGMGSIIVAFHNVWGGVPTLLTIYGWASLAKDGLYLSVPSLGIRSLEKGIGMDPRGFAVAGGFLLTLGIVILFWGSPA